ncbi:MAG: tetratricopeptide repeat protein [Reyranellaceae bacterium]
MALSDSQVEQLGRDALQRAAAGDFVAAETLFWRIAEVRPNSGQIQHLLGQVRLKLGRFAEAREPLQRAAQFLPRDAGAQINLAGCLSMLGDNAGAVAALERADRLKPGDAAINHNRGRALEGLGRLDEAERCYDTALLADHRLLPALSARAGLLARRGDWMGALADLDAALTARPEDPGLRLRRAELLLGQGDWLRGLADHEARLELPGERYAPALPRWQGEPLTGGRLLLYPEQAEIDGDAAIRDTLMLARGVDADLQAPACLLDRLDLPTVRRGAALDGYAAAAPLRSLPHLLGWTLDSLPAAGALPLAVWPDGPIGWFLDRPPPEGLAVERDAARMTLCRAVIGRDRPLLHLAARLGLHCLLVPEAAPDWLWGPRLGPSPWYPTLELVSETEIDGRARAL